VAHTNENTIPFKVLDFGVTICYKTMAPSLEIDTKEKLNTSSRQLKVV
jgi:hypothetical protein